MSATNSSGVSRNPYAGRRPARVASKIYRSRFRNKPVDRIMKRKPRNTINKKQNSAIMTLAKQVKKLQFQTFGDRQYQFQHCMLQNTVPNALPTLLQPIFFAANCFYNNTPVYYGSIATTSPYLSSFSQISDFTKQQFDADIAEQYQWNEMNNQETISKVEYLPEYMKYKFRFNGSLSTNDRTLRYRITFFKMKNMPLATTKKDFALPGAGGAYWHMCDDLPSTRNHFSKSYHEVIADRFVTFTPPTSENGIYNFQKVVQVPISLKSKVPLKPNITTDPVGQEFWTNVPQKDIIWCVISCNQATTGSSSPSIRIERNLHWRDKHGTTQGLN